MVRWIRRMKRLHRMNGSSHLGWKSHQELSSGGSGGFGHATAVDRTLGRNTIRPRPATMLPSCWLHPSSVVNPSAVNTIMLGCPLTGFLAAVRIVVTRQVPVTCAGMNGSPFGCG